MKRFTAYLLIFVLTAGTAFAQKIATVDMNKLFQEYYKTKQANQTLKEQREEFAKDVSRMEENVSKEKEEYSALLKGANDPVVSVEEREKRKKSAEEKYVKIEQLQGEISQFKRSANSTIAERMRRMRDDVVKVLREAINAKAKAGGFNLVLDVSGLSSQDTPIVLYSTGENDLTEAILADLNAKAPPELISTDDSKEKKK